MVDVEASLRRGHRGQTPTCRAIGPKHFARRHLHAGTRIPPDHIEMTLDEEGTILERADIQALAVFRMDIGAVAAGRDAEERESDTITRGDNDVILGRNRRAGVGGAAEILMGPKMRPVTRAEAHNLAQETGHVLADAGSVRDDRRRVGGRAFGLALPEDIAGSLSKGNHRRCLAPGSNDEFFPVDERAVAETPVMGSRPELLDVILSPEFLARCRFDTDEKPLTVEGIHPVTVYRRHPLSQPAHERVLLDRGPDSRRPDPLACLLVERGQVFGVPDVPEDEDAAARYGRRGDAGPDAPYQIGR